MGVGPIICNEKNDVGLFESNRLTLFLIDLLTSGQEDDYTG
jgi:hypothetical protein